MVSGAELATPGWHREPGHTPRAICTDIPQRRWPSFMQEAAALPAANTNLDRRHLLSSIVLLSCFQGTGEEASSPFFFFLFFDFRPITTPGSLLLSPGAGVQSEERRARERSSSQAIWGCAESQNKKKIKKRERKQKPLKKLFLFVVNNYLTSGLIHKFNKIRLCWRFNTFYYGVKSSQ